MTDKKKLEPSRRDLLRWSAYGALSALPLTAYAGYSTGWLSVERRELKLPKWDADGFRVAVLSDFHMDSPQERDRAISAFQLAMAEKPDLIALPGDFVSVDYGHLIAHAEKGLACLHDAPCPVVATLGNHDYDRAGFTHVAAAIQRSPAKLLRNETIEVGGVTVAGVDDALAQKHRPEFMASAIYSKSLLALFHEPDYVDQVPTNVSLQLSGHSHGGQVCLPGGIPVHTPIGSRKYRSGFYPDAKVPLYVTRGIGTIGPKLRLFCRPEISILTLRS